MLSEFLIDYLLWVFVSTLCVVQFVAARSRLRGILFARRWPRATMAASVLIGLATVVWYFASAERNQPDTGVGLDANIQAFWFAVSAAVAAIATLASTSAINHVWGQNHKNHGWDSTSGEAPPAGITWLSRTTFFYALRARIAYSRGPAGKPSERAGVR
jgi:hypothetical protein